MNLKRGGTVVPDLSLRLSNYCLKIRIIGLKNQEQMRILNLMQMTTLRII
jgi:hypothetical protein